jgi:hypothetical protein
MGTRADFYEGRGEQAEWLGSIAWDGYPEGIPEEIKRATDSEVFRAALARFRETREDWTNPEQGWPWPWETSHTTDFSYALDEGKVWASCFGSCWELATEWESRDEEDETCKGPIFPNMKDRQNVAWDKRSGIMLVTERRVVN